MANQELSFWRQLDLFSPARFDKTTHVIGVGAVGSYIALTLAKIGVQKIIAYDPDTVAPWNPPNQVYGIGDVREMEEERMKKVDALAAHIKERTGIEIKTVAGEVGEGDWKFPGIVFVCVDTMSARRYIYEQYLKMNLLVDLLVEVRMGAEMGKIYTIQPWRLSDIRGYEETLHSDEDAAEDSCTAHAITTVAETVAGIACHKLTKFQRHIPVQKEVIVSLNPILITSRSW